MLCHVALICTIYCITDMICTVACQEIKVVRFFWLVPPLFLSQLCQPYHKKQFIEKLLSSLEYGISKTKDKFLTTTVTIFFINNKTRYTYFNPLMPCGSKRSNILKQIYIQKLLFILSLYDLL